ncbi:hypothetical protein, partial [Pseudomonas helleri]
MKFNYFGYSFVDINTRGKRYFFDIRSVLRIFGKLENPIFKNGFKHIDENLYLFEASEDCYLFVMTRNEEIIKKIDTRTIGISELSKELAKDGSSLGFASLVMVHEKYFAIGTKTLSPKVDVFSRFINELIQSLGTSGYEFVPRAFTHKAKKEEIMDMEIIGRSTIEIPNTPKGPFSQLLEAMTGEICDVSELEGIEITFKPKNRTSNIKGVVSATLNNLDDISKAVIKAKSEASSILKELYLTKDGHVFDFVSPNKDKNDVETFSSLKEKTDENKILQEKVREFEDDKSFRSDAVDSLIRLNNVDS